MARTDDLIGAIRHVADEYREGGHPHTAKVLHEAADTFAALRSTPEADELIRQRDYWQQRYEQLADPGIEVEARPTADDLTIRLRDVDCDALLAAAEAAINARLDFGPGLHSRNVEEAARKIEAVVVAATTGGKDDAG